MPKFPVRISKELPLGETTGVMADPADFTQEARAQQGFGRAITVQGEYFASKAEELRVKMKRNKEFTDEATAKSQITEAQNEFLLEIGQRNDPENFEKEQKTFSADLKSSVIMPNMTEDSQRRLQALFAELDGIHRINTKRIGLEKQQRINVVKYENILETLKKNKDEAGVAEHISGALANDVIDHKRAEQDRKTVLPGINYYNVRDEITAAPKDTEEILSGNKTLSQQQKDTLAHYGAALWAKEVKEANDLFTGTIQDILTQDVIYDYDAVMESIEYAENEMEIISHTQASGFRSWVKKHKKDSLLKIDKKIQQERQDAIDASNAELNRIKMAYRLGRFNSAQEAKDMVLQVVANNPYMTDGEALASALALIDELDTDISGNQKTLRLHADQVLDGLPDGFFGVGDIKGGSWVPGFDKSFENKIKSLEDDLQKVLSVEKRQEIRQELLSTHKEKMRFFNTLNTAIDDWIKKNPEGTTADLDKRMNILLQMPLDNEAFQQMFNQ